MLALGSQDAGRGWVGGADILCPCLPPDLCAGGAVHRGHCGVGTADIPRAGDPGVALHFPRGLSVLRWRPAVRPVGRSCLDSHYHGLPWTSEPVEQDPVNQAGVR